MAFMDFIGKALGAQNPSFMPAGGSPMALPQGATPPIAGGQFKDPLEGKNAILKLMLGLGGIDAVNDFRKQSLDSQMGSASPSAVREYQYWQSLTPEQKEEYLRVKRAQQIIDMGGSFGAANPVTGGVDPLADKTLAPGDLPSTRGAQAEAAEAGRTKAERAAGAQKDSENTATNLDAFQQLREASANAPAGILENVGAAGANVLGIGGDAATAQGDFTVKKANAENAIRATFRVVGSGAQTDRDAQPLIDMLPNANDSADVKTKKIQAAEDALKSKANTLAKERGLSVPFPNGEDLNLNAGADTPRTTPPDLPNVFDGLPAGDGGGWSIKRKQ